ncbi:uncharacterized protein LOC114304801 [Camellia sinensis]|uniref:uncharacterized protein LOC114304801 n=1 Tax=Camellia sinensis TaxID=4442 RepID=UPI0010357AF1|nr:uncharacterized protein LOC114304801 [Camellia sinensis]
MGSLYLRGLQIHLFSQKTIILLTILVLLLKLRELLYLPLYGVTRQSCQEILATHGLAKSSLQSYLMILEKKFATKNVDAQATKRTRSPPIPSVYEVFQENSHLSRNDKIQAVLEAGVCPRLVELLLYVPICFILLHCDIDFKFVLVLALRIVGNIVNGDDAQTQFSHKITRKASRNKLAEQYQISLLGVEVKFRYIFELEIWAQLVHHQRRGTCTHHNCFHMEPLLFCFVNGIWVVF